jgi:hypothetical protein
MLQTFYVSQELVIVETIGGVVQKKGSVAVTIAHKDSSIGLLQIILIVMASYAMTSTEIHAADLWHAAVHWCYLKVMLTNWMLTSSSVVMPRALRRMIWRLAPSVWGHVT